MNINALCLLKAGAAAIRHDYFPYLVFYGIAFAVDYNKARALAVENINIAVFIGADIVKLAERVNPQLPRIKHRFNTVDRVYGLRAAAVRNNIIMGIIGYFGAVALGRDRRRGNSRQNGQSHKNTK